MDRLRQPAERRAGRGAAAASDPARRRWSRSMTIVNRFERVADQAQGNCQEVLYMCTGEYPSTPAAETFRVLFVDEHNACRSQMAEAIGNALGQPKFIFSSAGHRPAARSTRDARVPAREGLRHRAATAPKAHRPGPAPRPLPGDRGASRRRRSRRFPPPPAKVVCLDWASTIRRGSRARPPRSARPTRRPSTSCPATCSDLVEAVLGDAHRIDDDAPTAGDAIMTRVPRARPIVAAASALAGRRCARRHAAAARGGGQPARADRRSRTSAPTPW